jgi:signal transduction histidine kinase
MFNCFFFKRKREQKEHEQSIGDGLPAAIEHFVEEIQTAGGPDIEFCHELGRDRLPRNLRKAAFRIVKESLANACRHSKSKRLFAELSVDDDVLRIRLRDWGVDFAPVGTAPGRVGRHGIRQRVKLPSGTATIESEPGKGTCVTAELPLSQKRYAVSIGERRAQASKVKQSRG